MAAVPRIILKVSRRVVLCNNIIKVANLEQSNCKYFHLSSRAFSERLYTQKHEWVQIDGKVGTVGISSYAQEALGDVVYAQLPDVGAEVKQKDECGALESVKAASEIYSPVSGKIVEKNAQVEETPSLINTSCYNKGWLFKVELSNVSELQDLLSEEKYKEFLKSEEAH